jgi:hypothetical protein
LNGSKNKTHHSTDWDAYYQHPYPTAAFSRAVTGRLLVGSIQRYTQPAQREVVLELGGGNSCFLDSIQKVVKPREYHILDNNPIGLKLLQGRSDYNQRLFLHDQDVRQLRLPFLVDIVFSVGLIEHFIGDELEAVVAAHFLPLRPGGICILSFPTPTWLYWTARCISESLGMWIFWDEQPLHQAKVITLIRQYGDLLHSQINWMAVFTQAFLVVRKAYGE